MRSSKIETTNPDVEVFVQGFRRNEDTGFEPYVFVGTLEQAEEITLTPENAQILGEELRKHAEYAVNAAEEGE